MQSGAAPEQRGNCDGPYAAQQQQAGEFGVGDLHEFHALAAEKRHRSSDECQSGCQQWSPAEPVQAIGHDCGKLCPEHGHPEGR